MRTIPTQNQVRRIERAANRGRAANLPRIWATIEQDGLYIGIGDQEGEIVAETWHEAEFVTKRHEGRK